MNLAHELAASARECCVGNSCKCKSPLRPAQQTSMQSAAKVRFPPIVNIGVFKSKVAEGPQRPRSIYLIGRLLGIPAENRNHPRYDLHLLRPQPVAIVWMGGAWRRATTSTVNAADGAVRLMIASIRLMGQSKFMRSIVDATQPEQRHGLA